MGKKIVGLDIGSSSIKIVEMGMTGSGYRLYKAAAVARRRPGDPCDVHADEIRGILKQAGITTRQTVIGVWGKDVMQHYTFLPTAPPWKLKMMMAYKIDEIASSAGGDLASDFRLVNLPRMPDAELAVLVGLAKEPYLEARIQKIREAGLVFHMATPDSMAVFFAFQQSGHWQEGEITAIVNLGAKKIDVAVQKDGEYLFSRSVNPGMDEVMAHLADRLRKQPKAIEKFLSRDGARLLTERELAKATPKQRKISSLISEAMDPLLAGLESSLKFFQTRTRQGGMAPDRYVLTGQGCRLRGLASYMAEQYERPVDFLQPLDGILAEGVKTTGDTTETPAGLTTAVGLALACLKKNAASLQLVPARVLRRREFLEKTLYLWLALAAGILFTCMRIGGAWRYADKMEHASREALAVGYRQEKNRRTHERNQKRLSALQHEREFLTARINPGVLALASLAMLREVVPPEISLRAVEYQGFNTRIRVTGRVAGYMERDPVEVFNEFMQAIRSHGQVEDVDIRRNEKVVKDDPADLTRTFEIVLWMKGGRGAS